MDKLKHMKTFMLTVEEGSIAQAARTLGISKAAASKQLMELEANLNTQLLHRTTRLLKMTEIGETYYQALKNVFASVSEAESVISESQVVPTGKLRIGSHRHFGERFIINHLSEFRHRYPELKLDIELADRFPDLEKENFDVLCGIGHEGPDHLVRKKIATVQQKFCASPEYLTKHGVPKTPEDLKRLHYITHSFRTSDNIFVYKNNKEILLDYHIRLNDAQAMLKCALAGLGFIKIYNYFIDEHLKTGRLVEILKEFREPPKTLYIFYQYQKFLPNKIRIFIDFLCRKIKEDTTFSVQHSKNKSDL